MKHMLIVTVLLVPILVTAQSTWSTENGQTVITQGQEKRFIGGSPEEAIKLLTSRLSLTPDQVKKVKQFYTDHQKELEKEIALARAQSEMEAAAGGGVRTFKMNSNLRGALDKKIESILTPKQKKVYETIKSERKSAQPQIKMFQQ